MRSLEWIIQAIAVLSASVTSVLAVRRIKLSWDLRRSLESHIEKQKLQDALRSSDILVLGDYLWQDLGNIDLGQYCQDNSTRWSVDSYLGRILDFLRTSPSMEPSKPDLPQSSREPGNLPRELGIEGSLQNGESWNALARFRRYLEVTLRDIATELGLEAKSGQPISRIISFLSGKGVIPEGRSRILAWSVSVANQGIHGSDIPVDAAREAIYAGLSVLNSIQVQRGRDRPTVEGA